jgi:hypothetical protein
MQNFEIKDMLVIIDECIKTDRLTFLANMFITLQKDYQEIASLSTDGEYRSSWTHKQVLDYLTYLPQK